MLNFVSMHCITLQKAHLFENIYSANRCIPCKQNLKNKIQCSMRSNVVIVCIEFFLRVSKKQYESGIVFVVGNG